MAITVCDLNSELMFKKKALGLDLDPVRIETQCLNNNK